MSGGRAVSSKPIARARATVPPRHDDAALREKLCELANQRRRIGYRRLPILLRRAGVMINRKKTQRPSKEEGLSVRPRQSQARCGEQSTSRTPANNHKFGGMIGWVAEAA